MSVNLLPEPYSYLDLLHGQQIILNVTRWEDGSAVIHPTRVSQRHIRQYMDQQKLTAPPAPGTPISIETPVLRLFGTRLDQASPAGYWDISSKTARADLLARLQHGTALPALITLQANGAAPLKRYSITIAPGMTV